MGVLRFFSDNLGKFSNLIENGYYKLSHYWQILYFVLETFSSFSVFYSLLNLSANVGSILLIALDWRANLFSYVVNWFSQSFSLFVVFWSSLTYLFIELYWKILSLAGVQFSNLFMLSQSLYRGIVELVNSHVLLVVNTIVHLLSNIIFVTVTAFASLRMLIDEYFHRIVDLFSYMFFSAIKLLVSYVGQASFFFGTKLASLTWMVTSGLEAIQHFQNNLKERITHLTTTAFPIIEFLLSNYAKLRILFDGVFWGQLVDFITNRKNYEKGVIDFVTREFIRYVEDNVLLIIERALVRAW